MRFLVVICASIVSLIAATPSFAAVTAATISTANPNYVGPCPVIIKFTASITAAANTSYTYGFIHFPNGVQQPNLFSTGSGSGSIPMISDSMTFASSSNGSADQLIVQKITVQKITGVQPDYYSNKLGFSVTCATPPTPSPSPGFNFHNPLVYQLAPPNAPTNVRQTTNEQECGAHGFGFGCPIAMSGGYLVLVWCWQPAGCNPASTSQNVKAFNVYEVDNGKHSVVDNVTPDNGGNLPTAGSVSPPPGGFANQCYAVTAVMSDGRESGRSNVVCLGNGTVGNATDSYQPTASTYRAQTSQYGNVPFRADCNTPICLGWHHDQSSIIAPNIIPIWWYADNVRAYYRFDGLNSIKGHYIASATLTVTPIGGSLNCFSAIAAADTDWTQVQNTYIGGNFVAPSGSLAGGLDVTDIVRAWVAGGTPNYGFVLRASNESLVAGSTECRTELGAATLSVVHS
jgi:hypothetical protein